MEKKLNLGLKVLSSAALAGLLFAAAPVMQADALTENNAISVPKVAEDQDNQTLGSIVIKEDEDSSAAFRDGDLLTITLPSGVEYSDIKDKVYGLKANPDAYIKASDNDMEFDVEAVSDNYFTVKINTKENETDSDKITVYFGEYGASTVDIDNGVTGDIKVEIDGGNSAINSEYVTVGRINEGDTTTTIADTTTLKIDGTTEIDTIKIQENVQGKLEAGDDQIELKLPNDYKWKDVSVNGVNINLGTSDDPDKEYEISTDGDTLYLNIEEGSKASGVTSPGFITIDASIYVSDDADNGDEVEVTVDGNEVTKEDILIGTVGDYGFDVEVDEDVPTIVAGKTDQEIAEFTIEDLVDDSWLPGRTVTFELPTWAEFYGYEDSDGDPVDSLVDDYGPLEGTSVNSDFDELKFTVESGTPDGEAEFDDLKVKLDADAPEGDLVIKVTGSQGIDEEIVVAKVLPPFKVTAEKPEFVIGVQNQELGDITITETEDEALQEEKWVVIKAPNGMEFAECPTVKVADGDLEIDDEDIDENYFAFRIDGESAKNASEILISDIKMDLDRTVPVGDIEFEVSVTNNDEDTAWDFDDVFDDRDNYDKVMDVVVGEVVTPAPDETGDNVVMNLGSTLYTVNGVTKAMDVAPQVIDGRTFTPVRYVAESIGAEVAYDDATKTATLTKGETVVEFVLGSKTYTVNGAAQTMDVAAQAINGRTMLPARYVAEAFGYVVGFDPATKTVVISK